MKDDTYGLKLIQKYEPDAKPQPTDLVSAEFSCGSFRNTYAKMTVDERNSMRERNWYRDPNIDTWVYCPQELSGKLPDSGVIIQDGVLDSYKTSMAQFVSVAPSADVIREEILEAQVQPFPLD